MTDWQDISTAPKDGTLIIGLYWSGPSASGCRKGDVVKCWWQPEFSAFISTCNEAVLVDGYKYKDGTTRRLHSPVIEAVSHWTEWTEPLPAPPTPKGGA